MSSLLRNVTNSLWHAFVALQNDPTAAVVNKSRLKVLTANIGCLLDVYGVERGLDHYQSSGVLSFDHYRNYLQDEVFDVLPSEPLTLVQMRNYEASIEEVCWLICRRKYLPHPQQSINSDGNTSRPQSPSPIQITPAEDAGRFKLFRIFCMLADCRTRNGRSSQCEVVLDASEAALIVQQLLHGLGIDGDADATYNRLSADDCAALSFEQFLALFDEYRRTGGGHNGGDSAAEDDASERAESLSEAVEELFQTYIKDVIRKGYLWRRGYLLPTLKEYWFVLQPSELTFYKNATQRELCGSIVLDAKSCLVRSTSSSSSSNVGNSSNISIGGSGNSPNSQATSNGSRTISTSLSTTSSASSSSSSSNNQHDKRRRFAIIVGDREFELAAADNRSRLQCIAALQLAITYSTGCQNGDGYQRNQAARRRKRRELEQRRRHELEMQRVRHLDEVHSTRTQLEQERLGRLAAESQAAELQLVVREDSRRVAELEDVKLTLERLLLEETRAKHDEEIVRALQARVLAEEWEKRAELEQLQQEQRVVLEQEREKRKRFEEIQREREQRLRVAEQRLKQLEEEREKLDMELKQARFKMVQSEQNKLALEKRLQLVGGDGAAQDGSGGGGFIGGKDRLRRALSFMHTNRERGFSYDLTPLVMPVRSRSKSPQVPTQKHSKIMQSITN